MGFGVALCWMPGTGWPSYCRAIPSTTIAATNRLSYAVLSQPIPQYSPSLPLNRPWRFARDVVDHAIDAADFVDAGGDAGQVARRLRARPRGVLTPTRSLYLHLLTRS